MNAISSHAMTTLLRTLAAALPLFSLAACQSVLPTEAKVDFPTATAPELPASGPTPGPRWRCSCATIS